MMRRLDLKGYLEYEKYRGIRLTNQGKVVAENIKKRHKLLTEFFKVIGVSEDIAIQDAEGIEHHLHAETLEKLEKFLRTVNEYQT